MTMHEKATHRSRRIAETKLPGFNEETLLEVLRAGYRALGLSPSLAEAMCHQVANPQGGPQLTIA